MATDAQIQANRANAQKSCGPKTDEGKARARLNALKHGMRAQTVNPVLPHEDPAELEARIQEWVDDYQPTNAVERELVGRAAKLSWTLDRAERYETALLAKRVRKAMLRSNANRMKQVCDLGRKLFYMSGKRVLPGSGPAWNDDPAAFKAGLEDTPEGARWMLDRWIELRCLLVSDQPWTFHDQFKFVRLLGKHPVNASDDPELNEVCLAWEVIEPEQGVRFWRQMKELTPYEDPAFTGLRQWREIVPRPESPEAGLAFLRSIAEREIERLQDLLDDLEEVEGDDARELAEQASFSASDGAERLRRFQTARTRELLRTIDAITKLRKAESQASKTTKNEPKEANPPAPPKAPSQRPSPSSRPAPIQSLDADEAPVQNKQAPPPITLKIRANGANPPRTETTISPIDTSPFQVPPYDEGTRTRVG